MQRSMPILTVFLSVLLSAAAAGGVVFGIQALDPPEDPQPVVTVADTSTERALIDDLADRLEALGDRLDGLEVMVERGGDPYTGGSTNQRLQALERRLATLESNPQTAPGALAEQPGAPGYEGEVYPDGVSEFDQAVEQAIARIDERRRAEEEAERQARMEERRQEIEERMASDVQERLDRMTEAMALTAYQRDQMEGALTTLNQAMLNMMNIDFRDREARDQAFETMRTAREEYDASVENILSPQQMEIYEQENLAPRMGPGGGGLPGGGRGMGRGGR